MQAAEKTVARSGVTGLDDVLRGGFPRGRLMLIEGDPGVGKTTLALQFLRSGAALGERCLYVTLSETRQELTEVAASHGWTLDGIDVYELAPPGALTGGDENTLFHPSEVELAETTKEIVNVCGRISPQRVVFDSLSEIRLLAQSPLRYRREILALKQYFSGGGCTVLLLDDRTSEAADVHLQSIAHGVLSLEQVIPLFGSQRRRLRVTKLRGVDFRGGYHDFRLCRGGIKVYPRLVAAEHAIPFESGPTSSGVRSLDDLVGGGLERGTSTLLLGPAGVGKSTLASQWAIAAAERGEHAVLYVFDENVQTLRKRSASMGIDLDVHERSGKIRVQQIDPAEMPPGEFAASVRESVEVDGARLVVIDSLNGYLHAMPDESFLTLQLHELLTYLAQQGVTTLLVMAQHGLVGGTMTSPTDVSYLADAVLMLRHFEAQGALRKAISVLKKRTGPHETHIRELKMSDSGVSLGDPLTNFRGVFTGVPTMLGERQSLLETDDGSR